MRASLGRRKPTARGVVITAHPASGVRGDQMLLCLIRDHNHLRRDEEVRWFRTPPTLLAWAMRSNAVHHRQRVGHDNQRIDRWRTCSQQTPVASGARVECIRLAVEVLENNDNIRPDWRH
jgi:IS5 family transposase